MDIEKILRSCDHTELKAFATEKDIFELCEDAIKYNTASVCIPPSYVKIVNEKYNNNNKKINICTVIGFPLGYNTTEVKIFETKKAIEDGANEIDMVINIADLKNKKYDKILDEITKIKKECGDKVLKVIIETCYLTDEEKIKCCEIITKSKADFIKTSTGFGTSGANFQDIEIFKKNIGSNVKIKAAGGIKTLEDMQKYIELGVERIGTSRAVKLVKEIK